MGYAIPLKRIGTHVLDQITRARDAFTEAPDGGPPVLLRYVEMIVPFATADGQPSEPPEIVVGETYIPVDEAKRMLEPLERKVLVARADVSNANDAARGTFVMRVVF